MDLIAIEGLRVEGRHGASEAERASVQPFDVDVMLEADLRAASRSDDLNDTVNYAGLCRRIANIVRTHSYALLERLAAAIADDLFEERRIASVRIKIAKPAILDGATPSVTLRRANPKFTVCP